VTNPIRPVPGQACGGRALCLTHSEAVTAVRETRSSRPSCGARSEPPSCGACSVADPRRDASAGRQVPETSCGTLAVADPRAGRTQVARAKGRLRGRQPKLKPNQAKHLLELHDLGTYSRAELFGVGSQRSTAPSTDPAPTALGSDARLSEDGRQATRGGALHPLISPIINRWRCGGISPDVATASAAHTPDT
jgi:hypothetical protein